MINTTTKMLPPAFAHSVIHNSHLTYRPDIDGLRALAIISVVIFHAFPKFLSGGFVGVDVFFIISGYLITSIILKAQSGEGFSLLEFYSRRIKRIFPALIVVLIFCLVIGWFVLLADEYKVLGKHIAAGAGYVSNFVLKSESGYFDVATELKPLLHLWSLSIEEQFYLVFPILLIVALRLNLNPLAIIIVLLVASFMLNVMKIEQHPDKVFYLPFFRSWELLIGSILAYINLYKRHRFDTIASHILLRNPQRTANDLPNILAWLGVILFVLAVVLVNKSKSFPGWWALLPTLGAFFLIAAGEQAWFNKHILSSKLAVAIGLISYPLYLWHWPLLSFARLVEGEKPSFWIRLGMVVLSVLLAWATYWLIEKRLRFQQHWSVAVSLLLTLIMVGGMGYQVYRQGGYAQRYPDAERIAGYFAWDNESMNKQIGCSEKFGKEFEYYCRINDITQLPTVLLVGDSNANHFYTGLAETYAQTNDNLLNLGQSGCPPLYGVNVTTQEGRVDCHVVTEKALLYASETPSVKTIVLSMMGTVYAIGHRGADIDNKENFITLNYAQNPKLTKSLDILEDALRITLTRLSGTGKQIIFIMTIPLLDFDPASCVDARPWHRKAVQLKTPCAILQKEENKLSGDYRNMLMKMSREFPQVMFWDSARELCDGTYCWAMKNGVLLYRDPVHLNVAGSHFMAKRFQQAARMELMK